MFFFDDLFLTSWFSRTEYLYNLYSWWSFGSSATWRSKV